MPFVGRNFRMFSIINHDLKDQDRKRQEEMSSLEQAFLDALLVNWKLQKEELLTRGYHPKIGIFFNAALDERFSVDSQKCTDAKHAFNAKKGTRLNGITDSKEELESVLAVCKPVIKLAPN